MPTVITEGAAARSYAVMQLAFEEAVRRYSDQLYESHYIFGGYPVGVRVVGREMGRVITSPFSHLRVERSSRNPLELTIDLLDESYTAVRCQPRSANGEGRFIKTTAVSVEGRLFSQQLRNVLSCYNYKTGHIISSALWSDPLSVYERYKPLARLLLEWHNDKSIQVIHASLIARGDKGVLFAGKSGSGKSTSALACLCAGFKFLSEDYVGLQQCQDGSFAGHSLYNSVFLKIVDLARFPEFNSYMLKGLAHEEKFAVVLSQVFPDRLARTVPIRVILIPRIVDTAHPRFYRASKGDALLALGPSSLLQIPSRRAGAHGFRRVAQLIERTPCFWLELGRDLASIPCLVEEILSKLG